MSTPLGLYIYRYGFSQPAAEIMRTLLQPGDEFIDGGANIGSYSVAAAPRVGPQGRVVACEPASETMRMLRDNVALNGFSWIETHQVALGEETGRETLHTFGAGAGVSSFAPADRAGSRPEEVEVATLDSLAGDRVRLVKLDIEGAEIRALRGASRLLEKTRPAFIVEVEPRHLERQDGSLDELRSLFLDAGYEAHRIEPGSHLTPVHDWNQQFSGQDFLVRPRR